MRQKALLLEESWATLSSPEKGDQLAPSLEPLWVILSEVQLACLLALLMDRLWDYDSALLWDLAKALASALESELCLVR